MENGVVLSEISSNIKESKFLKNIKIPFSDKIHGDPSEKSHILVGKCPLARYDRDCNFFLSQQMGFTGFNGSVLQFIW